MQSFKLGRIFLISIVIPYSLILLLTAFYLYRDWKQLYEYETVRGGLKPLMQISQIITDLNRLKVDFVLEKYGFSSTERYKQSIKRLIENLNRQIKNKQTFLQLCNCEDIYLIEKEILHFLQNLSEGIAYFVYRTDDLIYRLNRYYLNLSSNLRVKNISDFARTFYFLNQQRTVIEDFFIWNLLYLHERKPYLLNLYPYLKGLFVAYSESYSVLLDDAQIENLYRNKVLKTPLVKNFLKGIYQSEELLLTDHRIFERDFCKYRRFVTAEIENAINRQILKLRLEILFILAATVVALVFFAFVHYRLYSRGVTAVNRTVQILRYRSSYDALTNLLSRREFHRFLFRKLPFYFHRGEKWSLILLDLDNFKKINDTYGHDFGDKVLKQVANLIRKNIRRQDLAFRWGGEEFAIFIKGNKEAAYKLAERLKKAIENTPVEGVKITASFGVGEFKGENPIKFFRKVDKALYKAKSLGKNRVEVAD